MNARLINYVARGTLVILIILTVISKVEDDIITRFIGNIKNNLSKKQKVVIDTTNYIFNKHVEYSDHCSKVNDVVFIKTHKTGSSSTQNIFLRYGLKNNLNFAVQNAGFQLYGPSWTFIGQNYDNMKYNIFCLHARFDYERIRKVMGSNHVYITILRDPVEVFISAWNYYNERLNTKTSSLDEWARSSADVTHRNKTTNYGPNQLLWDLGVDDIYNESVVDKKIQEIDDKFHLVMILEHYEESLILMKDLLCWETSDIFNLKLNARNNNDEVVSQETRELLAQIMKPDYKLYNHFKRKFENRVEQFGKKRMENEISTLQRENNQKIEECKIVSKNKNELSGENKWAESLQADVVGYMAAQDDEDCSMMTMAEKYFVKRIQDYMLMKYPLKLRKKIRKIAIN